MVKAYLEIEMTIVESVLSVESVGDKVIRVELVQDPVSVVLHGCCEDYQLIVLRHFFEELSSTWSDQKSSNLRLYLRIVTHTLNIMDECFVKV